MKPLERPGIILVVDDEPNIRRGLRTILVRDGHTVHTAGDAATALEVLDQCACDVALLDIRLPGRSGVELATEIRRRRPHTRVIMLTGHGALDSALGALRAGAFDYLLKPARPDQIRQAVAGALAAARQDRARAEIVAVMRAGLPAMAALEAVAEPAVSPDGPAASTPAGPLNVGTLRIDPRAYTVHREDRAVNLTPTEFRLLLVLARHAGQVLDYQFLVRHSLEYETEPWEARELIKRHIFALRQKIEREPNMPRLIVNVRGIGYRLATPAGGGHKSGGAA